MTLYHADGFDHYGTTAGAAQVYSYFNMQLCTVGNGAPAAGPRTGSTCIGGGRSAGTRYNFRELHTQVTFANAVYITDSTHDNETWTAMALIADNEQLIALDFHNDQTIGLINQSEQHPIVSSPLKSIPFNTWFWLEFQVDWTNNNPGGNPASYGTVTVRVNGNVVLEYTGPGIPGAACKGFGYALSTVNTNGYYYYDDLVVMVDTLAFPGDRKCQTLYPAADTAQADWALNGVASGFQALDNVPPDATKYLSATDAGERSTFDLEALDPAANSVLGVALYMEALKTNAGDCNIQGGFIAGGGEANGQELSLNQVATWSEDVFEKNPATNAAWKPADFVGAQFTLNRTK